MITAVIRTWLSGGQLYSNSVATDGSRFYSYMMPIARKVEDRIEVLDVKRLEGTSNKFVKSKGISATTRKHVHRLIRELKDTEIQLVSAGELEK